MIKYVELFNVLPGERQSYETWAGEMRRRLAGQPELLRITVYENALFTTPHRVVELEFDDMASMERYFERPEVKTVYREWGGRCTAQQSLVLRRVVPHDSQESQHGARKPAACAQPQRLGEAQA